MLEALKAGETAVNTPFEVPKRGTHRGVGWHSAGRGYLTHHMHTDRHRDVIDLVDGAVEHDVRTGLDDTAREKLKGLDDGVVTSTDR